MSVELLILLWFVGDLTVHYLIYKIPIKEHIKMTEEEVQTQFKTVIAPLVIRHYGEGDTVALDTEFNNWTDTLCKDGLITDELYSSICRDED